jgi:hypothetical protein
MRKIDSCFVLMLAAVFPSPAFSQSLQPICNETKKQYGYTLERADVRAIKKPRQRPRLCSCEIIVIVRLWLIVPLLPYAATYLIGYV